MHLAVRARAPMESAPPEAALRPPTRRQGAWLPIAIARAARHGLDTSHGLKIYRTLRGCPVRLPAGRADGEAEERIVPTGNNGVGRPHALESTSDGRPRSAQPRATRPCAHRRDAGGCRV